jgi:hypothetical protein
MKDQYPTPRLVLGTSNPAIVALNVKNHERRKLRNEVFKRLNSQFPLAGIASGNVIRSLEFVQAASS